MLVVLVILAMLFIVLVVWSTCNTGVLKDLAVYKTNTFNQVNGLSNYEYLFFSKELPLGHPNAQNFHYILPMEPGLYIGRPAFLKLFSANLLIPWIEIDSDTKPSENSELFQLYLPKLNVWLGVKEKHKQKILSYKNKTVHP